MPKQQHKFPFAFQSTKFFSTEYTYTGKDDVNSQLPDTQQFLGTWHSQLTHMSTCKNGN